MNRTAIFPGSFDPITIGHESILQRALPLFEKIIVAIGQNTTKKSMFPIEKRQQWIEQTFAQHPQISVQTYQGLTVDFCRKVNAGYILRGLRTAMDFEYERAIAQNNRILHPEIDTFFLLTNPEHTHVNSTIVRDIILNGGDAGPFVPAVIKNEIANHNF